MKLDEKRGLLILRKAEADGEDLLAFELPNGKPMYAGAIMGLGKRCGQPTLVIYSATLCIEWLTKHMDMSDEVAAEWFDTNTADAWIGEQTPMILEDRL